MLDKEEREERQREDEACQKILKKSHISANISVYTMWFGVFVLVYREFDITTSLTLKNPTVIGIGLLLVSVIFRIESLHLFHSWKHERDRLTSERTR